MSQSINGTLLFTLPENGILSDEDRAKARSVLAKRIDQKYNGFKEFREIDLRFLLDHYDRGEGFSAETYRQFVRWLLWLMMKPDNALELEKGFPGTGRHMVIRLLDFFEGLLESDDDDSMRAWLFQRNCRDYISEMPDSRYYELWAEFMEPTQIIKTYE